MFIFFSIFLCKYSYGISNEDIGNFLKIISEYKIEQNIIDSTNKLIRYFKEKNFKYLFDNDINNFREELKNYRFYIYSKINIYKKFIELKNKLTNINNNLKNGNTNDINICHYIIFTNGLLKNYDYVGDVLNDNIIICSANIRLLENITISFTEYEKLHILKNIVNNNIDIDNTNTARINKILTKFNKNCINFQKFRQDNDEIENHSLSKLNDEISTFEIEFIELFSQINKIGVCFYLQTSQFKK